MPQPAEFIRQMRLALTTESKKTLKNIDLMAVVMDAIAIALVLFLQEEDCLRLMQGSIGGKSTLKNH